jgi:hypothetical protein
MMRTLIPALTIIALTGLCIQADAQDRCPELTRLRSEAADALKQATTVPRSPAANTGGAYATSEVCESYIRFSVAWGKIAQYAKDHRESCDISILSLNEFERYHGEALKARDRVCAGGPLRSIPPDVFPPDVIQR